MGYISDYLRDSGATTLDVDLRTGSYEDRSQYKNIVTANGTPTWSASERGWGLSFQPGQYLVSPANPVFLAPKAMAAIADPSWRNTARLISLRNSTTDIELQVVELAGVRELFLFNGAGTSIATGNVSACVVNPTGNTYTDKGTFTFSAANAAGNANNCCIGNSERVPASLWYPRPIYRSMLFNRALSSVEAQSLLQELLTERIPTKVYSTQAYVPVKQIGTPALHWSLRERDASGQFPDLSGNGRGSTTIKQATLTIDGAKTFDASGYSLRTNGLTETIGGLSTYAVSLRVKPFDITTTANTSNVVSNGSTQWYIQIVGTSAAEGITVATLGSGKFGRYDIGTANWNGVNRRSLHIVFAKDGANDSVFVNGKQLTRYEGTAIDAVALPGDVRVGTGTLGNNDASVACSDLRIYQTSSVDIRKLYLEGSRVVSDIDLTFAPVTFESITTANTEIIPNSGLRLVSGSVGIVSSPRKAFSGGFVASMPLDTIGGSIRCSFNRGDGETFIGWSSVKGNPTATGQNGYWLRATSGQTYHLQKSVAGVRSAIGASTDLTAGDFDIQLNWEFDGTITWWYRILGSKQWILGATVVDTAITSTGYLSVVQSGSLSRFINRITVNEIALTPEEWDNIGLQTS